jgi:hypothetical protein
MADEETDEDEGAGGTGPLALEGAPFDALG